MPYVRISVEEARNLPGNPSTYCIAKNGRSPAQKSSVVEKTKHPRWMSIFYFVLDERDTMLSLEIVEKRTFGADKVLCSLTLNMKKMLDGGVHEDWFKLLTRSKKHGGDLRLALSSVEALPPGYQLAGRRASMRHPPDVAVPAEGPPSSERTPPDDDTMDSRSILDADNSGPVTSDRARRPLPPRVITVEAPSAGHESASAVTSPTAMRGTAPSSSGPAPIAAASPKGARPGISLPPNERAAIATAAAAEVTRMLGRRIEEEDNLSDDWQRHARALQEARASSVADLRALEQEFVRGRLEAAKAEADGQRQARDKALAEVRDETRAQTAHQLSMQERQRQLQQQQSEHDAAASARREERDRRRLQQRLENAAHLRAQSQRQLVMLQTQAAEAAAAIWDTLESDLKHDASILKHDSDEGASSRFTVSPLVDWSLAERSRVRHFYPRW